MKTHSNHLGPMLKSAPLEKREQRRLGFLMRRMYRKATRLERYRERKGPRRFLDEAIAIAKRRGDEARNTLVETTMRFAMWFAKRYLNGPIAASMEDLMSVAAFAIVRKTPYWNPTKGSLSTYLSFALRQVFNKATGRGLLPTKEVARLRTCSLNADNGPIVVDPDQERHNRERAENAAEGVRFVRECFPAFNEREQQILTKRFRLGSEGESQTFGEIGESLGISKQRAEQIESRLVNRLTQHVRRPIAEWVEAGAAVVTDRRTGDFKRMPKRVEKPTPPPVEKPRWKPVILTVEDQRRMRYEQVTAARLAREAMAERRAR